MPSAVDAERVLASCPWRDQVTDEQVSAWLRQFETVKTDFQREEVLHYVTLEQVQTGVISLQSEYDYLVSQYQPALATTQPLQSPEQTFGEKTVTRPCPKCRSRDTTFFIVQLRSADEPSSVVHKCGSCGHNWKYR